MITQAVTRALAPALSLLMVFAIAEGVARLVDEQPSLQSRREYIRRSLHYLEPCFVHETRGAQEVLVGVHTHNDGGDFVWPVRRRDGIPRFAIVGESTGMMIGGAIAEMAHDGVLPEAELMNCAMPGSALEHLARTATEVLETDIDAIVVVFSHNLRMHYPTDAKRLRAHALLLHSRLLTRLAALFEANRRPDDRVSEEVRLDELRAVLGQLAAHAHERGVRVIFVPLASNEAYPPSSSDEVRFDPRFVEARLSAVAGKVEDSIETMERLVAERHDPYWLWNLSRWQRQRGDHAAAARAAREAIDRTDITPDRATSVTIETIRSLAAEHDAELYDLAHEFAATAAPDAPGWRSFRDNCHPNRRAILSEARRLSELITTGALPDLPWGSHHTGPDTEPKDLVLNLEDLLRLASGQTPSSERRALEALSGFVDHWSRALPEVLDEVLDTELDDDQSQLSRNRDAQAWIVRGYRRAARHRRARQLLARGSLAETARGQIERGLLLLAEQKPDAADEAFARALELDPQDPEAAALQAALRRRISAPRSRPH